MSDFITPARTEPHDHPTVREAGKCSLSVARIVQVFVPEGEGEDGYWVAISILYCTVRRLLPSSRGERMLAYTRW